MNHQITTAITTLIMAAGLALASGDASGQVTMQFPTIKDVQITGFGNEQLSHAGNADSMRVKRHNQDITLLDFDTDAMGTFLADNPGAATWTLNVWPSTHAFILPPAGPLEDPDVNMPIIMTVESTNDWSESLTGTLSGGDPLTWDPETAAATYFYAQTWIDVNGALDVAMSLPWNDPDSGIYTFTGSTPNPTDGVPTMAPDGLDWDRNPTPEFENSVKFGRAQINLAQALGNSAEIDMDSVIIDAMLNDPNNRGLRFGSITIPGDPWIDNKWGIWSKDAGGADGGFFAPFLEVTISPAGPGDFDADGDVDGADFLVWQQGGSPNGATSGDLDLWENNFGTPSAAAAATGVPEPSSLLLLLAAGSAMLGTTRRPNRRAV